MQESPPSSKPFIGVRFILLGFDPVSESQVRSNLINGGGVDAGQYNQGCTHVIVNKLIYDDPMCVAARNDNKRLLSGLWVDHSFYTGMPADTNSIMYRPLKDLKGIPGAQSLVICLTGYQQPERDDIMTMAALMGAQFSKPLLANKVTHLICYKFDGEKYELAKKMKKIKLVNHCWLEDCLRNWRVLPEKNYIKSGYELELEMMEAEAKDSEEDDEDTAVKELGEKSSIKSTYTKIGMPRSCDFPTSVGEAAKTLQGLSPSESLNVVNHQDLPLLPTNANMSDKVLNAPGALGCQDAGSSISAEKTICSGRIDSNLRFSPEAHVSESRLSDVYEQVQHRTASGSAESPHKGNEFLNRNDISCWPPQKRKIDSRARFKSPKKRPHLKDIALASDKIQGLDQASSLHNPPKISKSDKLKPMYGNGTNEKDGKTPHTSSDQPDIEQCGLRPSENDAVLSLNAEEEKSGSLNHFGCNKTSTKINKNDGKSYRNSMAVKEILYRTETRCFILSGRKLQRMEFQQVIKDLKGRFCGDSHHWSDEATHFIAVDPIRRTEKFFAAAASGRWILKTDYVTASSQAGKFLAEKPYEWHDKCFSEDGAISLDAPRKWRLLKERTGHGAFYGMRIIIYGDCIALPLETLKRAVKAGDGTILATSPPYTNFLKSGVHYAIVSPDMPQSDWWVQEFLKHAIPCVVADYLVDYVCKPGYSLEKHVLYNTQTWVDKSFDSIRRQAEETIEQLACTSEGAVSGGIICQVCGSSN